MRTLVVVTALSLFRGAAFAQEPTPPPPPSSSPGPEFEPPPPPSAPPAATATSTTGKRQPSAGWARPAAYISFGLAIAVAGLSVIDDLAAHTFEPQGHYDTSLVVTTVFSGLTLVGVPVMYIGGGSARFDQGISGSKVLRVLGWLAYAFALTFDIITLIDHSYPDNAWGLPEIGGGLGAAAFVCFGFDALWSAQEAEEVESIAQREDSRLQLAPRFAIVRGPGGSSAPSLGVGGRF